MQNIAPDDNPHPRCAVCDVPMWLIRIERGAAGTSNHYECKACDARKVIAAANDDLSSGPLGPQASGMGL